VFKVGDIVDIKANGSVHKGMPHKFYHGKTGVVWNVTRRGIGVEVNKVVRTRMMKKRIHVRMEHLKHSTSRTDFLNRVKQNQAAAITAKATGVKTSTKRIPAQPRPACFVKNAPVEDLSPKPFKFLYT
jgi:large subunit ribosomal protein L21e